MVEVGKVRRVLGGGSEIPGSGGGCLVLYWCCKEFGFYSGISGEPLEDL